MFIIVAMSCTNGTPTVQDTPTPTATPQPLQALLPPDPDLTCTVSSTDFNRWFASETVDANGEVTPADSLNFKGNDDCDFFKHSWRMFLWLTSPAATGGGRVFDGDQFFDVAENFALVSEKQIFTRASKAEDIERTGEAGGINGVLMSQNVSITPDGSLVYYGIQVNDVYAYFLTGVNNKKITASQFPSNQATLTDIEEYAKNVFNVTFVDGNALTMELKTSWVEVGKKKDGTLEDASKYITIMADIPKYTHVSDKKWTWDGTTLEKDVTLALVGFHVVGSAKGHPEMIWATFEHMDNAPNNDYSYTSTDGNSKTITNFNSDGTPIKKDWLFFGGEGEKATANIEGMHLSGTDIEATSGNTIGPSDTYRTHPWGYESSATASNTEIISVNNNIIRQLADGDVRKNYALGGAIWTQNGQIPGLGTPVTLAGSTDLANATLETYEQPKNCFTCHSRGKLSGLSHIYGSITPLPTPKP